MADNDTNDYSYPLPVGRAEFNTWADRLIEKAGRFADERSMKYALASQIIHLPHDIAFKNDAYFVNSLRKAAANQVASAIFQEIKMQQAEEFAKAKEEAEKARLAVEATTAEQPAEVTAPTAVASDERQS